MQAVIDFLISRAKEKSTWLGIAALILGIVGVEATAVQTEQIAGALTILVATILGLLPDRKQT